MIGATPSATPTPAQPVASVTSTEALPPPADPPPVFVPPSVTDPVSNLAFPPVDDGFALEMRAETIEQLAGGDALRRGESERIEAGRSETNADLVAGRDRVRVQATLHEHTGHGLAEQVAHLHTTVAGKLDVHAASEDTVLLAGHMRDLWDGGASIVAAMTDDTVAGGGIRVTTPLDLWVHGLMGVEERIGTCTADAVLMESSATHYEREYGPGVHAAGLAVYTGSLYQSNRSTFGPLIRVSSGVRNLIAGSGGGGAGGAPGASPPPVPAETGAASESVTGTLAAGHRAAQAPETALDTANPLTDARRVPLEELVNAIDTRVAEEMGETGTVMRAEDLPELTRSTDTAERLGAPQETLRIDATAAASEAAGGFRASEAEGAVSIHPATGKGGPLAIEPPAAVCGENAPMVRPRPGDPWDEGPEIEPGLLGGADRPPRSAAPESDFRAVNRRLHDLRNHYQHLSRAGISEDFRLASERVRRIAVRRFKKFGGKLEDLAKRPSGITTADHAFVVLQQTARQAERDGDLMRAGAIRKAINALHKRATEELQGLTTKYAIAPAPPPRAMQRPPATTAPTATATVAAIPPPAHTPIQFDWITGYCQLRAAIHHFSDIGWIPAYTDFRLAARRVSQSVTSRFKKFGGRLENLRPYFDGATKPEQAYLAIQDMFRRSEESDNTARAYEIRQALESINQSTTRELDELTRKYGALRALSTWATQTVQATQAMQRPPATAGSPVTVASTTVAPPGQLDIPGPAHPIDLQVDPAFPEPAGGLAHATNFPGPPLTYSLSGPSLAEATGAEAGDPGRGRLDPPATDSGATAAHPAATETIVTPSLGETSSFWLQPVDPAPAPGSVPFDPGSVPFDPGSVPFDSGLHHAGETVQPPPVTTTASSTAPVLSPGAPFPTPSRVNDDFTVERALLAGELPPGFDASWLIAEGRLFADFGLAEDLAAGRLPIQTIDCLIEGYRATDEGGSNALFIEYLRALKESIARALRAAYRERADRQWLDHVRELLRQRGEPVPPSAASTAGLAELDVEEIDRLLGTGEGVSHPAPPPRLSAPGRAGAGAGAPPPAADPWRIRPPGMSGEPHPVAFDPWSAPPGPSSRVMPTRTSRAPVMSTDAPPGWQRAETPGFGPAASGAVELPFSHRQKIAHRFRTDDALLEAEYALQTGSADALGWSATRWRQVLDDLYRLHDTIVRSDSATAAAMVDVDWRAIEALGLILDVPPSSP